MTPFNALLLLVAVSNPGDVENTRRAGAPPTVRILRFTADWCPACKAMDPTVQRLQRAGVPIDNVDVDRQRQLAARYRIAKVPTLIMTVNGRPTDRLNGQATFAQITSWYRRHGGQAGPEGGRLTIRGQSPQGSRLDELLSKSPPAVDSPRGSISSAAPVPRRVAAGGGRSQAETRAFQATVRIKVEDERGFSFGTGTIIDTHDGEALIITCGHLFRESRGRGAVSVDLNAPDARQPVKAELIAWDAGKRDIAVLSIRPNVRVVPASVAGVKAQPRQGQAVFSIGCDEGRPATIRRSQIVTVNRYQGPANIQVKGFPTVGRSGGGLFNDRGELIGVCRAADREENQGIYGGLPVVHGQLDRIRQSALYRQPRGNDQPDGPRFVKSDATPSARPSSARQSPARQSPARQSPARQSPARQSPETGRPTRSPLTKTPAPAVARPTELICIVRDADGRQRTIVVRDPSAQLVRQVHDAAGSSRLARRNEESYREGPLTLRGQDGN